MITLYSGTPGSGKSLDCARTIYNWCRLGRPVICNFPINVGNVRVLRRERKVYYVPNSDLSPDELVAFSREYFQGKTAKEDSILLMLDESQLLFNARDWRGKGRDRWNWFFTMHRHFGFYIILCAQFDQMLDFQIRCLIEYEIIHRKVKNMGWRGWFISALMLSPRLFVRVQVWYPMHEKINAEFFRGNRRYFSIYDTFQMIDTAESHTEDAPIRTGVLEKYRLGKTPQEALEEKLPGEIDLEEEKEGEEAWT